MKIRPGIMAIIIRPWAQEKHLGLPVSVVRAAFLGEVAFTRGGMEYRVTETPAWRCDAEGSEFPKFIHERCLRPIGGLAASYGIESKAKADA